MSGVSYLGGRGFEWTPSDMGFIYSFALTSGFIVSIGTGLFGALKESEEFLIAGGAACIALALLNKVFTNLLYSWSFLDAALLLAGGLMIADRFHVKQVKKAKRPEPRPEELLERLDRLELEAGEAKPETLAILEREIYEVRRKLWLEAEKKPELVKPLRIRLYRKPIVQKIVERFIDSGLKTLEPAIEISGAPRYPKLTGLEEYPPNKIQSALNMLVESGILLKDLYEKLVACPHCHQPSKVFIRNKCSKCSSHKVRMNRLMEHVKCGAIYRQQEYATPSGLKCPKCGKTAGELELKPVGVVFECESCENMFGDPVQTFYCRRCAAEFDFKSSELVDTYAYTLNKEVKSEAQETLTVINIADAIEKLGYKTQVPGYVKGKTGVKQEFTLTCYKEGEMVAVDLAMSGGKVDLTTVLSSYAKFIDIPDTTRLLIAIPSLEPKAKDFLEANQIPYIEADNLTQITEKLKQHLK